MQITPHNTGKVKIGSCYQPPINVSMSGDMERLQSALLGHRGPRVDIDMRQVWQGIGWAVSFCLALVTFAIFIQPVQP